MNTHLYNYLHDGLQVNLIKGSNKILCQQDILDYLNEDGDFDTKELSSRIYKYFKIYNSQDDFELTISEIHKKFQSDTSPTITADSFIPAAVDTTTTVEPVIETYVEPVVEPVIETLTEPVVETLTEPVVEPVVEIVVEPKYKKRYENVIEEGLISDFWEDEDNKDKELLLITEEDNMTMLCKQSLLDFKDKNKRFVVGGAFELCESMCLNMLLKSNKRVLYLTEFHKSKLEELTEQD